MLMVLSATSIPEKKKKKKLPSPKWQLARWSSLLGLRFSFSEEMSLTNLQAYIAHWYHPAPTCVLIVTWGSSVLYHVGSLANLTKLGLLRIDQGEAEFDKKLIELCYNQIKFLIEG